MLGIYNYVGVWASDIYIWDEIISYNNIDVKIRVFFSLRWNLSG